MAPAWKGDAMREGRLGRAASIILATAVGSLAPASAAPVDRTAWLDRVERGRQDYRAFVEKASLASQSRPAIESESRRAVDADPTLRDGDILVRADRLVVFRARAASLSAEGAFVPFDPASARIHAVELRDIARALQNR